MIYFHNPSPLDLRAITTFGLNAKPNSKSPIGYFGTGLKYALAVLAREGQEVSISTGGTSYSLGKRPADFRGKGFDELTLSSSSGEISLPFTTELGKNWKLWQAYRELYCNAKDEGGDVSEEPISADTVIAVSGPAFFEVHTSRRDFILSPDTLLHALPGLEIHKGSTKTLFYRGIKVYTNDEPYQYTYNFLTPLNLTEDRTVVNPWALPSTIRSCILSSPSEEMIQALVSAPSRFAEKDWNADSLVPLFAKDLILSLYRTNKAFLTLNWCMWARAVLRAEEPAEERQGLSLSPLQTKMLAAAKTFLSSIGYSVKEPITVEDDLDGGALGLALSGRIYLSKKTFDMGLKQLTITLLEEHLHIRHGLQDESRAFQEFLLHGLITLGQELTGDML